MIQSIAIPEQLMSAEINRLLERIQQFGDGKAYIYQSNIQKIVSAWNQACEINAQLLEKENMILLLLAEKEAENHVLKAKIRKMEAETKIETAISGSRVLFITDHEKERIRANRKQKLIETNPELF